MKKNNPNQPISIPLYIDSPLRNIIFRIFEVAILVAALILFTFGHSFAGEISPITADNTSTQLTFVYRFNPSIKALAGFNKQSTLNGKDLANTSPVDVMNNAFYDPLPEYMLSREDETNIQILLYSHRF